MVSHAAESNPDNYHPHHPWPSLISCSIPRVDRGDLLLSAPAVLTQKLSVWAIEEEVGEMREETKALKA